MPEVSITKLKAAHDGALAKYGARSPITQRAKKVLRSARQARRDERASRVRAYDTRGQNGP
jgi:hypothetical protein